MPSMLKFDQSTLANMTAALQYVYLRLPPDNVQLRKAVADAITAAASKGKITLAELQAAGLKVLGDQSPPKRSWLSRMFR